MQHDHVMKKLNFEQLTASPGFVGGGGGVRGVCRHNTWYRVAVIVILLNLICNMILF